MPEGHTLHRLAREHRRLFAGAPVRVASPQGRFAEGARLLDGRVLESVEAYGKHLFYRWEHALVLHVHLGLFGVFTAHGADAQPSANTRLALSAGTATVLLSGPTACELVTSDEERRIRSRLGPDPLRRGADVERVRAALRRRTVPVGAALLDQAVLAGVGNVFRAEALFVTGIDPWRPARELSDPEIDALWETLVRMLRQALRLGRIVTVDPAEAGRARSRIAVEDGRYVYRRTGLPCRRCGTPVLGGELAARRIYWCSRCQPADAPPLADPRRSNHASSVRTP